MSNRVASRGRGGLVGWRMPTHVNIADGARHTLPEVLQGLDARRVLLVIDPGLAKTPWPEEIVQLLTRSHIQSVRFERLEANPRTATAERAADLARAERAGAVVGLGGGSALDTAKAAAMLATNRGRATDFAGKNRFSSPPLPFVALPTTCGTGSEVTWVSVLSDPAARTKISLKGEAMFPAQALVDPDLLATLPPPLVAATGADALTHALEATTCRLANAVSDALAEQAVALLFRHLPRAVADIGGDDEARFAVARASTLAGLAFGNADVASVHCLSESLGGLFDVPHGLANAVLLRALLTYNRPLIDSRLAALGAVVGAASEDDADAADRFLAALGDLLDAIGIPGFAALEIPRSGFDEAARRAESNGSNPSNARAMTADDYRRLLDQLAG